MYQRIGITGYVMFAILVLVATRCGHTDTTPRQTEHDFVTSTPTYEPLAPGTPIFFAVRAEDTVQVWKTSVDGTTQDILLELPIRYPVSTLPAQELAILRQNHCPAEQNGCFVEDLYLDYGMGSLRLSPDKQLLAWGDGASWCPNTGCYGFQRLVLWDMVRANSQTLLEIPSHIDLRTAQGIGQIAWSPDGGRIGFVQSSKGRGWSRVYVVDIETGQIREIGNGDFPLAWAPDGERIAFKSYSPEEHEMTVKVVSGDGTTLTTLSSNWNMVNGIDWSPNGSKVAISAVVDYQEHRFSVFIADSVTGDVAEIEIATDELLSYEQPRWSPDGRVMGANTRPSWYDLVNGLAIFDPQSGTVHANLTLQRANPEWSWFSTGNAILVRLGGDTQPHFTPQALGIFYWMKGTLEQVSLSPLLEPGIKKRQLYLGEPIW